MNFEIQELTPIVVGLVGALGLREVLMRFLDRRSRQLSQLQALICWNVADDERLVGRYRNERIAQELLDAPALGEHLRLVDSVCNASGDGMTISRLRRYGKSLRVHNNRLTLTNPLLDLFGYGLACLLGVIGFGSVVWAILNTKKEFTTSEFAFVLLASIFYVSIAAYYGNRFSEFRRLQRDLDAVQKATNSPSTETS